jgi:hypothetical protein
MIFVVVVVVVVVVVIVIVIIMFSDCLGLRLGCCCMFLAIMLVIGSRMKRSLVKQYFGLSLQMPSELSIKVYLRRIV